MKRVLVVIGYQPDKLAHIKKKDVDKLTMWIQSNQSEFEYTMSIVRVRGNMLMEANDILDDNDNGDRYRFIVDKRVEVQGFDCDTSKFSRDCTYYLCGMSTGASIMCMAMSLYSASIPVRVLKRHCFDRKGMNNEAFKIMNAYMPGVVVED